MTSSEIFVMNLASPKFDLKTRPGSSRKHLVSPYVKRWASEDCSIEKVSQSLAIFYPSIANLASLGSVGCHSAETLV